MTLGEKLREARANAHITQAQLGNMCGLSQQRIAQYENGYRQPKAETLTKIINALYDALDAEHVTDWAANSPEIGAPYATPEAFKSYIMASETELDYAEIIEPYSKLNKRGKAKTVAFAYDLLDDDRYRLDKLPE